MFDRTQASDWATAKNVLCVLLESEGDLRSVRPAIAALKNAVPRRHITLLTSSQEAQQATRAPEIDAVILYDPPWVESTVTRLDSRADYLIAARLGQAGFDGAVIFTKDSQNALPGAFLCYLANIPLRLAHANADPHQLLTHWAPEEYPGAGDEVRRHLALATVAGAALQDERLPGRSPERSTLGGHPPTSGGDSQAGVDLRPQ